MGPEGAKILRTRKLVVILEIQNVTNTERTGATVTERHLGRVCKFGAETKKKGRRNALTIRKLLSLQKGSPLRTTILNLI